MEKILVICAHPDDESLGMGGTIVMHAKKGDKIFVLIMATGQFRRDESEKGIKQRQKQGEKACSILGVNKVKFLHYADQKLDSIPLVELVSRIEDVIKSWNPTTVYTHYWADMNQDHRRVYEATLIASRPNKKNSIKRFLCFEIPSSSEITHGSQIFNPNFFVDIKKGLSKKLRAFNQYRKEIRKSPHPRSKTMIISRAHYWGSFVNLEYVESFVKIREIER